MGFRRVFVAALFLVLSVSAVNAYTVIMRDGRRVEIPNQFTVTSSTLTYEVSNGFQVTIQLNTVDIAATERANGEARGSLLMKVSLSPAPVERAPEPRHANAERTITNMDLEKFRNARLESEDRRRELGLPSLEDRQREVAAIEDRTMEQVREMRARDEAYWRSRAEAIRAQSAADEAQRESLRQRAEEIPWSYSFGGFPSFLPFDNVGLGITGGRFKGFRRFQSSPFSGFLATPITPFPTFPVSPVFRGHGRTVRAPGVHINPRPFQMRHR